MVFERFGTAKFKHYRCSADTDQMLFKRGKTDIARLSENRVAFPTEVAEAEIQRRIVAGEQRIKMPVLLSRNDVCPTEESDNVVGSERELPSRGRSDDAHKQG